MTAFKLESSVSFNTLSHIIGLLSVHVGQTSFSQAARKSAENRAGHIVRLYYWFILMISITVSSSRSSSIFSLLLLL